jgi:hypothetical protein
MLRDAIWIRLVPFTAIVARTKHVRADNHESKCGLGRGRVGRQRHRWCVHSADGATWLPQQREHPRRRRCQRIPDIFVRDQLAGTTELVSVDSGGAQGNGVSGWPSISADGRYVAFNSSATNLVPGDTNGQSDIFVPRPAGRDDGAGEHRFGRSTGEQRSVYPRSPRMAAAWRSRVGHQPRAAGSRGLQVYVHDRQAGTTTIVSVDSVGVQGNGDSVVPRSPPTAAL